MRDVLPQLATKASETATGPRPLLKFKAIDERLEVRELTWFSAAFITAVKGIEVALIRVFWVCNRCYYALPADRAT